ncbi:MAG: non-canonical purine NTP pyrophosphatase, partial [Parasphingorhabdus sp.]
MTTHRKLAPGRLIIASHNQGKVREIRALLEPYGIEPVSAGDLDLPEPEETGTTFAENALLKARASAEGADCVALADDSGLCVSALGGRPGVYTADWAERQAFEGEPGRDWYMAMGKVEGLLAEQGTDVDRSAYFVATLALAWPDGHSEIFEGRVEGKL